MKSITIKSRKLGDKLAFALGRYVREGQLGEKVFKSSGNTMYLYFIRNRGRWVVSSKVNIYDYGVVFQTTGLAATETKLPLSGWQYIRSGTYPAPDLTFQIEKF